MTQQAIDDWLDDRAPSMGAALAFYSSFSIAPLLIVAIAIAGLVFGREAATGEVIDELRDLLGDAGANTVKGMLASASHFGTGVAATAIGIAVLLVGATTAFVELQDDLDRIWKAKPRVANGIVNLILSRILSFGMVLCIGFLLTISLVLSAVVAAAGKQFLSGGTEAVTHALELVVSFAITTLLFALIYKLLPNARVAWKDVWAGAALTSLLFSIGKFLIGFYIGKSEATSPFGAAAPFVLIMLWAYYSAQIFLLGAEFTHVFAQRRGSGDAAEPSAQPSA